MEQPMVVHCGASDSEKRAAISLLAFVLSTCIAVVAAIAGVRQILAAYFARRVVTPARQAESPVRVRKMLTRAGLPNLVWLEGVDSGLPGKYSFMFDGGRGHARLGPVVKRRGTRVARELLALDRGRLRPGVRGRITGWWYTDPAECGVQASRITFPGETGELWAWLVTPEQPLPGRWAVHVHGRGALPEETLRGVLPLSRVGVTSLVLAYRGDPGSAPALNNRYGLGLSEQRDVDAAIAEAVRRGAKRVTLVGWSMGASACVLEANSGVHREFVDGLALDSPALDWAELLQYQAGLTRLPARITTLALKMLAQNRVRGGEPGGIDFTRLDAGEMGRALRVPTLVQSSPGDSFVPESSALNFAAANPDYITLRRVPIAEHVRLWNVDPLGWEGALEGFVRRLPDPASRT